jgi:hypothetical protein
MRSYPGLSFQQDNAEAYAAAYTKFQFMCAGLEVIKWPSFSPDLNLIETV